MCSFPSHKAITKSAFYGTLVWPLITWTKMACTVFLWCFTEEIKSFRFSMAWGWVNYDRFFISDELIFQQKLKLQQTVCLTAISSTCKSKHTCHINSQPSDMRWNSIWNRNISSHSFHILTQYENQITAGCSRLNIYVQTPYSGSL